jgi:anion-transporting  ArsA/GET3 family ATPase
LRYDQIVVDAPPTGRLPRFLDAPRAIVELVGAGPIRRQAKSVRDMVEDPRRLQVVLVTHPEEMAVRETIEAAETLGKMGVALGPIVVNGLVPSIPNLGRDPEATLRAQAREENLALDEAAIAELARVAASRARRARNKRKAIAELNAALDLPHVELPLLFTDGIGRAELDLLAARLREPT